MTSTASDALHTGPTSRTVTGEGPSANDERSERGGRPFLRTAAGIALLAFPVFLTAGMATSPPQASNSSRDYVASLGADPALTALSAGLLHYSWVLFALGILAVVGLVPGRRGRVVTGVAALATSFSAIQLSGLVLADWYASAMANALPLEKAAAIFEAAHADVWASTWLTTGRFVGFLGVPVIVAALAWARAVSWWLVVVPAAGFALMVALGGLLPGFWSLAIGSLVGAVPMVVIGLRLVRRDTPAER